MKISGLSTAQHWVSWLVTACGMNILYTGLTVIICRMCNMFGDSSYIVVAVFFYFYLLSLLTFGMLIAVFFEKQQSASAVGMGINVVANGAGWVLTTLSEKPQWVRGIVRSSKEAALISFS